MKKPQGLGKPTLGQRGVRAGLLGQFGTGKTEFVFASIPKVAHLIVVDTEGRSQFYDADAHSGFEVLVTKSPKEILGLLKYAEHLCRDGQSVVFAVDSMTSVWHAQQDVAASIGSTSAGTAKFSSWAAAKAPLKKIYKAIFETPLDCVFTMRSKAKYVQEGGGKVKDMGYDVSDMERNFPYTLDLVLELAKDEMAPGKKLLPKNFYATVVKTSGPAEGNPLPIGMRISNPSFADIVAMRLEGNMDRFTISDDVGLQVALSTVRAGAFWAWAVEQGQDEAELREVLEDKFGKLTGKVLPDCIKYVWEMR